MTIEKLVGKVPLSDYMESRKGEANGYVNDRSNLHKLIRRELKEDDEFHVARVGKVSVMYVDAEALDRVLFGAPMGGTAEEV